MANPTADALSARAKVLRTELLRKQEQDGGPILKRLDATRREVASAEGAVKRTEQQIKDRQENIDDLRTALRSELKDADQADATGRPQDVAEARERVEIIRTSIKVSEERIAIDEVELARTRQQVTDLKAQEQGLSSEHRAVIVRLHTAEQSVDGMERKAEYLNEADGHAANAVRLQQEASQLRAAGKTADADETVARASSEEIAALAKRGSADEQVVDDAAIAAAGLPPVGPIPPLPAPGAVASTDPSDLQDDFQLDAPPLDPVAAAPDFEDLDALSTFADSTLPPLDDTGPEFEVDEPSFDVGGSEL